jgi:hypothetical protein
MMISVTRGGGGSELCGVFVLCGAGGGLTEHADNANPTRETTTAAVIKKRRTGLGTLIRVTSSLSAARATTRR